MSRDQNAGQSHSMKIDNSYFARVEEFKCLGTNATNHNSIQEEIKWRLKSGNACYNSVQNFLSPMTPVGIEPYIPKFMSYILSEILMLLCMTDICETLFAIFDVEPYKKRIFYTRSKTNCAMYSKHCFRRYLRST